jgi:hypothetical protein
MQCRADLVISRFRDFAIASSAGCVAQAPSPVSYILPRSRGRLCHGSSSQSSLTLQTGIQTEQMAYCFSLETGES